MTVAGATAYTWRRPAREVPSVAVIPFVNAQESPNSAYLADGISEGLIHALAQIPGLKVIARSSSFQFRNRLIDVRQVARKLGVQALVTGSVAESGNRLRITVDLVARDATQIWGMQYNSAISGLAGLEAGISSEIAQRIGAKLTEIARDRLTNAVKVNPEAYESFLRARYHLRLYTPESRNRAVGYYQQALAIDPSFALAHAELAHLYRLLGGAADMSADETIPRAKAAALRALSADRNLAEAHAVMADIKKDAWDWTAAEEGYRKALELNRNLVTAHQGYAIFLGVTGKHKEAIEEIRRARELDPLGLPTAIHAGAVYYNARRYREALETFNRAVELDPGSYAAWSWIGIVNGGTGQYDQAIRAYERAAALGEASAATQCYYAFALARSGRQTQALQLLERLRKSSGFVPLSSLAILHLGLNQKAEAIQALQAAYAAKEPLLQYLRVESHFDELANEPQFCKLAESIGLPRW
jgi:TolB-like protein/Tfp pilus assembly protein PilF